LFPATLNPTKWHQADSVAREVKCKHYANAPRRYVTYTLLILLKLWAQALAIISSKNRQIYNRNFEASNIITVIENRLIWDNKCAISVETSCSKLITIIVLSGSGSSVGIASGYGLDGPGIETWCGRDFSHPFRPARGPTHPPVQWVPGLSGSKAAEAWC
jgi:hypothetical protein